MSRVFLSVEAAQTDTKTTEDYLMKQTFTASVWREDDWFVAQCLEVDVVSQGQTEEEALANLREALELYFEPPVPTIAPHIRSVEVDTGVA